MKRGCLTCIGVFAAGCLIFAGIIQLIPYGRNHTNPPVVSEPVWNNTTTKALAQRACFDCHSNLTVWRWYSNIAPFSWLIQRDVDQGRRVMNFSDWQNVSNRRIDRLSEVISRGSMPPLQYLVIHWNAILTSSEKQELISGLQDSLANLE
ncbi:MAG: heme-binding domain-containing protein [Chloroflexi bacterium]|nr:heme-binding domain-containing protein [Chloroflexota bacterium]